MSFPESEYESTRIDGPLSPPKADAESSGVLGAVTELLARSDWNAYEGPVSERLRELLSQKMRGAFVQLSCSATAGLQLILKAMRLKPGDEVILAGYDYPGNFRVLEAAGASIVLVDLRPWSWAVDLNQVENAISPQTKAIIVAHLHSTSFDAAALRSIANRHQLLLVEDACQTQGATIEGRPIGSFGHAAVWSFGGGKLLTAGRGGAVFTWDAGLAQRIKVAAQLGSDAFGLSQLQAAALIPQVEELASKHLVRKAAAVIFFELIASLPGVRLVQSDLGDYDAAYYKLGWMLDPEWAKEEMVERFLRSLRGDGAHVGRGFPGFGLRSGRRARAVSDLRQAKRAAASTILLSNAHLTAGLEHIRKIANAVINAHRDCFAT